MVVLGLQSVPDGHLPDVRVGHGEAVVVYDQIQVQGNLPELGDPPRRVGRFSYLSASSD